MRTTKYFLLITLLLCSCKKKDSEAPVISLNGDAEVFITLNGSFEDPGATASDNTDGILNVTVTGTVDTNLEGNYELVYSASDAAGNSSEAARTVHITNDAFYYKGDYQVYCYTPDTTILDTTIISTSTIINNRIWFQGFSVFSNTAVFADLSGNTLQVPKQQSYAGGNYHYFKGSGNILTGDTIKIQINFSDSLSGTVISGSLLYKRPY
jgi:hypothetical protein